ncbi:hypothetical protein [Lampropedia aestuarii]|uniref:hypothetical protein n=1 Tax=Lampropedia aestuarii TaxID=2562762 RepID=UPI0024687225|nr:hypothetical protein [Lampropedia aestuarii]MDH5857776.1 hypothetical protein [Lampropedia aestuarii]
MHKTAADDKWPSKEELAEFNRQIDAVLEQLEGLSLARAESVLESARNLLAKDRGRVLSEQPFSFSRLERKNLSKQIADSKQAITDLQATSQACHSLASGAMSAILSKRSASNRSLEQIVQEAKRRLRDPSTANTHLSLPLDAGVSQPMRMPDSELQPIREAGFRPVQKGLPLTAFALLLLAAWFGGKK